MEEEFFESATLKKEREKYLTTGCQKLDALLGGGIACRGITQIYGASSTGKTQLALQLCLTVQLPAVEGGLAAGAVYICTESIFPSRRLQELIQKLEVTNRRGVNGDLIFVEHASTIDELETCLLQRVPLLMTVRKIGLIIIDSIAAPYRVEDWNDSTKIRGKSLRTVGEQLHKLCKNDDVCIICINQVTAVISNSSLRDDGEEAPALGTTWQSMVTNSIRFHRTGPLRYISIKLSSKLPETTTSFEIHGSGVRATG